MGGGKKKKDPAKELAKKQRKAAKQERCAAKREGKLAGPDEEVDLLALIAAQRLKDAARGGHGREARTADRRRLRAVPAAVQRVARGRRRPLLVRRELNEGDQTTVFNDLYRYRTAKDEWPSLLGKRVVFGDAAALTQFYHYRDLWRLDTRTHAWELVEPAKKKGPSARSGHRCCEWRGKILLFGFFKRRRSEIKCDNAVKAQGKEHGDCWKLTIGDPFAGDATPGELVGRVPLRALTPDKRCLALASAARLDQAHVFGGVHDVDGDRLSSTSLFYDDLHVLDLGKRKWKRREAGRRRARLGAPWDVAALASALAVPPPAPPRHKAADAAAPPKPARAAPTARARRASARRARSLDTRKKAADWTCLLPGTMRVARRVEKSAPDSDSDSDSEDAGDVDDDDDDGVEHARADDRRAGRREKKADDGDGQSVARSAAPLTIAPTRISAATAPRAPTTATRGPGATPPR
ncbi:galactose oxidase [Aureococcus anophagefferens]|uniref:Galactose oxidase n=1 Tax=Aureococcus anophagefferens TaxID=44056 RepID=A0ABR1FNQ3_AURAN